MVYSGRSDNASHPQTLEPTCLQFVSAAVLGMKGALGKGVQGGLHQGYEGNDKIHAHLGA